MTSIWMGIAVVVCVLLGGIVATVVGWRGRRIDQAPLCRRCGFDLTGLPESSNLCSECGHHVRGRRGMRHGRRKTRWALLTVGVALLLTIILPAASVVWVAVRSGTVRASLPNWYVLAEARRLVPKDHRNAINELISRDMTAPLSLRERNTLARAIIDVQTDSFTKWRPGWGDWIVARMADDGISKELGDEYVRTVVNQWIPVQRDRVRPGDAVPIKWRADAARAHTVNTLMLAANPMTLRAAPGEGKPVEDQAMMHNPWQDVRERRDLEPGVMLMRQPAITSLPQGNYIVRSEVEVTVHLRKADGVVYQLSSVTLGTIQPVSVMSNRRDSVTPLVDEELRDSIAAAIHPARINVFRSSVGRTFYTIAFDLQPLAIPVCYTVSVRQGDVEVPAGRMVIPAYRPADRRSIYFDSRVPLDPGSAEVILTPDPAVARDTPDIKTFWMGELRYRGVRLYDMTRPAVLPP